jgi:hypothetical protein
VSAKQACLQLAEREEGHHEGMNFPIKRESSSIAAAKVITFFEIAKYSHSFFFLFGYVKENVYLCTPIYNVRKLLLNKERK